MGIPNIFISVKNLLCRSSLMKHDLSNSLGVCLELNFKYYLEGIVSILVSLQCRVSTLCVRKN